MKLTFGIIVLNGDFFLRQVLESIYPYAHAICVAEGPVRWWFEQGVQQSTDDTFNILHSFPDPENKIKITHGVYAEKDEQCQDWFRLVPTDTDYVVCVDADEVHSPENLEKLIAFLEAERPTSVGFKSDSFFGGFDRIIGGFERDHSFKRVLQYLPGCYYRTHRQPTLAVSSTVNSSSVTSDIIGKDITGNQLYEQTGITMWHGSYVSARGVYNKIRYYENAVISKGNCIPNYFLELWMNWVKNPGLRTEIEQRWKGVQEFAPHARGECYTQPFTGVHPPAIEASMEELIEKFNKELKAFV
jgi:hypothetical protein